LTGDKRNFKNFKRKEQGFVTYGDNNKGKILGTSDVGGGNTLEIKDVLFVEGLKHNLFSISQLCDKKDSKSSLRVTTALFIKRTLRNET